MKKIYDKIKKRVVLPYLLIIWIIGIIFII